MYIYLFAILPIFYSIIIYLLFIFLIIYWLAYVGDLLSATYCRRPRVGDHVGDLVGDLCRRKSRKLQVLLRKIRILRLEWLIVTFLQQSKRSVSLVSKLKAYNTSTRTNVPTKTDALAARRGCPRMRREEVENILEIMLLVMCR